jgi:uncharacterized protein (TIGR02266 family)
MSAALSARTEPWENRAHPRVTVRINITLSSDNQFYTGISENLSEGGVFVATYEFRKVGETVDLTLLLPNSRPIFADGVVRWVRDVSSSIEVPPGMGIEFVSLNEMDTATIRAFLRLRAPLLF